MINMQDWRLIGLLTLIAVLAVMVTVQLYAQVSPWVTNESVVKGTSSRSSVVTSDKDVKQIEKWHLFGKAELTAVRVTNSKDIKLHGVFLATNPKKRRAVISVNDKDEELYRVGDKLPGNLKIQKIEKDRVVYRRNGKLEAVVFDDQYRKTGARLVTRKTIKNKKQAKSNSKSGRYNFNREDWQKRIKEMREKGNRYKGRMFAPGAHGDSMRNLEDFRGMDKEKLRERFKSLRGKGPGLN